MYYMWINKNLVHQVGDQTKVSFGILNTEAAHIQLRRGPPDDEQG